MKFEKSGILQVENKFFIFVTFCFYLKSDILNMNDSELATQILNGNANAFRYLVSKHQKLVVHIVGRIVQQHEDVEDICQEVFLKVFRMLKNFRGESKLSTWIATIAYNTSITYLKKHTKEGMVSFDEHSSGFWESKFETTDLQWVDRNEIKSYLLDMIEKLPVNYRTVITLFHLEEFSYREIEEITKMPEGTIKSYLSRAREMLKLKLEQFNISEKNNIFAYYD